MEGMNWMPNMPIEDLVQATRVKKEHLPQAFHLLWQKYSPAVLTCCRRKVGHDDAEDIAMDVYRKLWQAVVRGKFRYRGEKAFRAWLFTTLHHTIIDYWKRESRLRNLLVHISLNDDAEGAEVEEFIPCNLGADLMDQAMRELVIEVAEECLSNERQIDLVRRRMLGWPLPTEWTSKWVNTNWKRATEKLKAEFKNRLWGAGNS